MTLHGGCLRSIKKFAFRTDASTQIGTGHFMRCITLADELQKQGAQVCFICRNLPAHLSEMLCAKGIVLKPLRMDARREQTDALAHSYWLGNSQAQDAQATIQALGDYFYDWLIVDHYSLDEHWEKAVRANCKKLMVIDDLADRHHDCDVLLDQNFYEDMQTRYVDKVPLHCQLLLGPSYALLRDEFRVMREKIKSRSGVVKNILVFFGGVDKDNYTGLALQAFVGIANDDLHLDVVIGEQHPFREQIQVTCAIHGYVCHVQTTHMAELMAKADLAIGAGGSATWERCCLGLPTLSFCVASNQRRQIEDAAAKGLLYAPSDDGDLMGVLQRHIQALLENIPLLKHMTVTAMDVVDGRGVIRVTNVLSVNNIEMRRASFSDSPKLFEWRNHPTIRTVSKNSGLIAWESHHIWLTTVLADNDRELLIGYIKDEPVGVVRFDKEGDAAEVSIYLVPEGGFSGQGSSLLLSAEQWLKKNRSDIKCVRACIMGGNELSKRLFLGAKYRLESTTYLKEL
jgi:UDP-2,4-diacetamido-2,4,6-trideoxy-beta-L-altropyranose hydrolase